MARFFHERGHDVHVITFERKPYSPQDYGGIPYYILDTNNIWQKIKTQFPLIRSIEVKRLLEKIQPEILHSHFITNYGRVGMYTGFHPHVMSAWGSDVLLHTKKIFTGTQIRHALHTADLIHCGGKSAYQAVLSMGINPSHILVAHYGVDTRKFTPGNSDRSTKIVISTRMFHKVYDIQTLIRAIPKVLQVHPDTTFVIVGEGPLRDDLVALATDLKVQKNILFPGVISQSDLARHLSNADIYVSTSLSDGGLANSTAEAMASGLPVIVTDFGENREWIQQGQNGCIFPPGSHDQLAKNINYLLNNPDMRNQWGMVNRHIIQQRLDIEVELGKIEKAYESLLADQQVGKLKIR